MIRACTIDSDPRYLDVAAMIEGDGQNVNDSLAMNRPKGKARGPVFVSLVAHTNFPLAADTYIFRLRRIQQRQIMHEKIVRPADRRFNIIVTVPHFVRIVLCDGALKQQRDFCYLECDVAF